MQMGSFNWEVINPAIWLKERSWQKCEGWSFQSNINKDIDISKVGENDVPF
jgi:hypothetical protein